MSLEEEIKQLRKLAGIYQPYNVDKDIVDSDDESNVSITGSQKRQIEREKNIKPGTDEWFRLWFSNPKMTGETPYDKE